MNAWTQWHNTVISMTNTYTNIIFTEWKAMKETCEWLPFTTWNEMHVTEPQAADTWQDHQTVKEDMNSPGHSYKSILTILSNMHKSFTRQHE
jgi:hypothetical protein